MDSERVRGSAPIEFLLLGVPLLLFALVGLQLTLIAHQKSRLADFAVTLAHELALADRGIEDLESVGARILSETGAGIQPNFEASVSETSTGEIIQVSAEVKTAALLISLEPLTLRVSAQAKTELD